MTDQHQEIEGIMIPLRRAARTVIVLALLPITFATGVFIASTAITAGKAGAAETETIVGTASITHEPRGWEPNNFYLMICPANETYSQICPGQQSGSPNQSTGTFRVKLPAVAWKVAMYYYTVDGQLIFSKPVIVPAHPGKTFMQNITMSYVVPAVQGKMSVTGAPKDFNSIAYMGVQACPGKGAFRVGCNGGQEAYEDVGPGSAYLIDLSPGLGPWPRITGLTTTKACSPGSL